MAPRLRARLWPGFARGAFLTCALVAGACGARADEGTIVSARFDGETRRYAHFVLGRRHNWDSLILDLSDGRRLRLRHDRLVFEDTAPRLVDLDGDGLPEVLTVESGAGIGARLVVYGVRGGQVVQVAATPHIGQGNRWYAPVGAADLDGDGAVEVAFVDRPHLAQRLRIWRYRAGEFTEVATYEGVSNHRIGETDISGGIAMCDMPRIVLALGDWAGIVALTYRAGRVRATPLGLSPTPDGFARALACEASLVKDPLSP